MFKPRHAYKSPITNRYRGKAKGCPVFNTLTEIDYLLVEQHDECLECLLKINNNHHNNNNNNNHNHNNNSHHNNISTNNTNNNNPDHDASSSKSWSSSYNSPPSPMSTSSINSSLSSPHNHADSAREPNSSHSPSSSSPSHSSDSSSCSSTSLSPSPSPTSSPDLMTNELRRPRLKLSEKKIRKIKKLPISFDDNYYSLEHSFASTPTTSSGCSPGQHSNTTQNSDQSRLGGSCTNNDNTVIHTFQAPARFVNYLKPCNLPTKLQESKQKPAKTPPVTSKELLNCAICGVKESNISKVYGQNSCLTCSKFIATFLKRPKELFCAQDGDCLMTFDTRCQACWIKICLQKFDIEDDHRKIRQKYSPKLLSSPKVSLITIDTSLTR